MSIQFSAGPVVFSSAQGLSFGEVFLGAYAEKTFYLKNRGTAPLDITSIKSDNLTFTVEAPAAAVKLNQDETVTVTLRYSSFVAVMMLGFSASRRMTRTGELCLYR